MSLIKTRCRASRRGEVFSPVGVRLPNPYENVHLCLEFAIYQTHVIIGLRHGDLIKSSATKPRLSGDVVAAKTSIVEKTLTFVKQCGILKYLLVKRSNFGYLLPLLLTSLYGLSRCREPQTLQKTE